MAAIVQNLLKFIKLLLMEKDVSQYKTILLKHTEPNTAEQIIKWVVQYKVHLVIKRERKTKLGDYSHPHSRQPFHKITINGSLNKYAFFITFIHELAHLRVFNKYKNSNYQPHGIEWKNEYFSILTSVNTQDFFPNDIQSGIFNHLQKIKSSTSYDSQLSKILMKYDKNFENILLITDIEYGTKFTFRGRIFEKGEKIKTRIKCLCLNNNRHYTFSSTTPINKI